ncbi:hypothetical protein BJP25_00395 [Actinokineospora bangkokensis]|uniref:Uncharacterized protein n=1 Tax=Actinokineospora bangkokensis TaxID=1193682 RepID=A0A1Q9LU76_9PSEU|nr:hypothetical protein BJP25_00395 [Actinokineospora bangkokensis]
MVEPPAGTPALADPATARALRSMRVPFLVLPPVVLALGVLAGWLSGAGAPPAVVTLVVIVALAFAIALVLTFVLHGLWLRPAGRMLAGSPWRPASVAVHRASKGLPRTPLVVSDGERRFTAVVGALPWAVQQVLARTGRVWVVGPDESGWVALRSTGLLLPLGAARVSAAEVGPRVVVEQPEPLRVRAALEDLVVARQVAVPRRRSRTGLVAPALLLVFALVGLVDLLGRDFAGELLGVTAAVVAVVLALAALLVWRVRVARRWSAVEKSLAAGAWTAVPVVLDPPADQFPRTVTGTAEVGGRTVPVRLVAASAGLRANTAATGTLWTAGAPAPGAAVAAGLPGYPYTTLARFGG